jgi:mannose-6-phosphate isomerase-like protein (cupin superfamily)
LQIRDACGTGPDPASYDQSTREEPSMTQPRSRPPKVGQYELLLDFECAPASVRVIELRANTELVEHHVHRKTAQIYVALRGQAVVDIDGQQVLIEPYRAVHVPAGAVHGVHAASREAVVMNISVPPLAVDDQVATER